MSQSTESYRYERKFLVPRPFAVEPGIRRNPACFSPIYHPRVVNNIYLDSPGLRFYFHSVDGAPDRIKVRIRWYGELLGISSRPVLEFKIKRGLLGTKESFPLKPLHLDETFTQASLQRILRDSDLPPHAWQVVNRLEPALINRYRRSYQQSADRKYRLTLDSHLEFHRVRTGRNSFFGTVRHVPFQVVELKYDQAYAEGADGVSRALPFRMTKMSKYTHGMDSVDGF
jgi:hypothetical protein